MKSTEELVRDAGGIKNLEMFSAVSHSNKTVIDQLAVVKSQEEEIVIVQAFRRRVPRGGSSYSNWSWNDTNGGQNDGGGGSSSEEDWTPIASKNTYAERAKYYCDLHRNPSIGIKTNFFAAASRVMKTYSRLDLLSDSPSGIPGDQPSWRLLKYNRSISEYLRNKVNPEISNRVVKNSAPFGSMTLRQRDVALVEYEQSILQVYLDSLRKVNPVDYDNFVKSMNDWLDRASTVDGLMGPLLDQIGFENNFRIALDLAEDRAGSRLDFGNKAHRIMLGVAVIDGVVEDKAAGRPTC